MKSILIAELFGALHSQAEEHIRAGRQEEAVRLIGKLKEMNLGFAKRGGQLFPDKTSLCHPFFHSEN